MPQTVRFIKPWKMFKKGDVTKPGGLVRDWLINNGVAVLVEDTPKPETAAIEQPVKRRRGRPRKKVVNPIEVET